MQALPARQTQFNEKKTSQFLLITEHAHVTTESETHQNDWWQGGKTAAFYLRHARVAFCRQFESTKMTENKINIVVFDSSNALLDSLEISVIDHGIKLIQMVEEIVKDYSVDDSISILIENKLTFLNLAICNDRSCSWGNKIIK